jgi:hypothetical protein
LEVPIMGMRIKNMRFWLLTLSVVWIATVSALIVDGH